MENRLSLRHLCVIPASNLRRWEVLFSKNDRKWIIDEPKHLNRYSFCSDYLFFFKHNCMGAFKVHVEKKKKRKKKVTCNAFVQHQVSLCHKTKVRCSFISLLWTSLQQFSWKRYFGAKRYTLVLQRIVTNVQCSF